MIPNDRNIEYPELEGTDKDQRVQLLALLSTTSLTAPPEIQTWRAFSRHFELWQPGEPLPCPTTLWVKIFFLTPDLTLC